MSETKEQGKHTPGPWKIAEEDVTANLNGWRRNFILVHSTVYNHGQTALVPNGMDERGEANASLIAAAPELLEALRNCVDGLGCQPGYVNTLALTRAQAAIAKAEGR